MNEEEQKNLEKPSMGEQVKQAAKNQAKQAGKQVLKEATKQLRMKAMQALAAAIPVIIKIILITVAIGVVMVLIDWVENLFTSNEMSELTTDLINQYCNIDDDGVYFNDEAAIATIKKVLDDNDLTIEQLGLGLDETQALEYLYDYLKASMASEIPHIDNVPEKDGKQVADGIIKIKRAFVDTQALESVSTQTPVQTPSQTPTQPPDSTQTTPGTTIDTQSYGLSAENVNVTMDGINSEYKIAWISDLHVMLPEEVQTSQINNNWYSSHGLTFESRRMAFNHSENVLPNIIDCLNNNNFDAIVFGGDIIDNYSSENITYVKNLINRLTNTKVMFLAADHDYLTEMFLNVTENRQDAGNIKGSGDIKKLTIGRDGDNINLVGQNYSNNVISDGNISTLESYLNQTQNSLFFTHVPVESKTNASGMQAWSKQNHNDQVYYWSSASSSSGYTNPPSRYLDVLYNSNSLKAMFAGHVHASGNFELNTGKTEHIFDASYKNKIGVITISPTGAATNNNNNAQNTTNNNQATANNNQITNPTQTTESTISLNNAVSQNAVQIEELQYIGLNYFRNQVQEVNDGNVTDDTRSLLRVYSIDENWNLIVAKPYIVQRSDGTTLKYIEVKIPYRSMVSKYGMPFEFLFDLLQVTGSGEYIKAVSELVTKYSNIDITIFDNETITTTTVTDTYTENKKWMDVGPGVIMSGILNPSSPVPRSSTTPQSSQSQIITIEDAITANVTKAETWMVNQYTDYNLKTTTSTTTTTSTAPDEAEPSGDTGTWKTNQQTLTETKVVEQNWESEPSRVNLKTARFMGLWKNRMGRYDSSIVDTTLLEYVPYGSVVKYLYVGSDTLWVTPISDILQKEQWLYGLLENSSFAQTQSEYLKNAIYKYKTGNDLGNFDLSIFESSEFQDTTSSGNPTYGELGVSPEEYEILCKIVTAEIGGGTQEQQRNVASVILNRVLSSQFPNTIRDVVFQTNQFQPVRNGMYDAAVPTQSVRDAVDYVIANGDQTGCAVYFCTPAAASADSWWSTLDLIKNDGAHVLFTTEQAKNELSRYAPSTLGGGTIIEEAKAAHIYIENNGYKYKQVGLSIPNGILSGRTIDCSAYVSWVLYRAGLQEFSGHQKDSATFNRNPWGFQVIGSINDAQAGDILVYYGGDNHHVEIYSGEVRNGKAVVYNCGGPWSVSNPAPSTSGHSINKITKILRVPM